MVFCASWLPTVIVIAFSEQLIKLLFQRGAFTEQDTLVVQQIQNLFVLQVPFSVAGMVVVRFLSSMGRNYTLMTFSLGMLALNAVADVILAQAIGLVGIALSTSLVYALSFGLLLFESNRTLNRLLREYA
jgi:putative peptidoglycan lipid II flippase